VFEGFVSGIDPSTPVTINCENNMYLLKQTEVKNKVWSGEKYSLEKMLNEMISGTGYTVAVDNISTTIGQITTLNATVADVLEQIRKDYKYNAHFYGTELRVGIFRYFPTGRKTVKFSFNRNIAAKGGKLEYVRADSLEIKLVAYSVEKHELTTKTSTGKKRKSKKRLEVEVGSSTGARRTAYFPDIKSEAELKKRAEAFLKQLKYDGFHGSFMTFAIPPVRKGDIAEITDNFIKERSGSYMVKSVTRTGGVKGYTQEVELDYNVSGTEQYL
jgi:hypothetical protein